MSSPYDRPLPPLTDLPAPPRIPPENSELAPPGEIMVESRRTITLRLLRAMWVPALILIALWYTLLILYVVGAAPTMWWLTLLAGLVEPGMLRFTMLQMGFSPPLLGTTFMLLPVCATALSLPLLPVASRLVAAMNPRRFLSERGFQRAVSTRVTAVLMIPPMLVTATLPVAVLLQVPMPWSALGPGPLMALSLGAGAIMLAWVSIRAWVSAPRVLGIDAALSIESHGRLARGTEERRAAARRAHAQDRRHLPPTPGSPMENGAFTPLGALRALGAVARASLVWLWPVLVVTGWVMFGVTDAAVALSGLMQDDLVAVPSPMSWPMVVIGVPVLLAVLVVIAFAPGLSMLMARNRRGEIRDQRTYADWKQRARANPWEERVVSLTGVVSAAAMLLGTIVFAAGLSLVGAQTSFSWTWIVIDALVVAPLVGLSASAAMRTGLRDVVYGPPGRFMRRETPYVVVAPDIGTRTDRAKDPAVRAELRRRLQQEPGDHTLEIFDLDAAGERFYVDESLPGAKDTHVRSTDVERGLLPDFGGEGSPFTAGSDDAAVSTEEQRRHAIPDSVTGLRER